LSGETNLQRLLGSIRPDLAPEVFVFVSAERAEEAVAILERLST
jgi:hypothetical protein